MKRILFVSLIILLIVLSGCKLIKKEAKNEPLGAFISGKTGLQASFLKNSPPDQVYDNNQDEFDIGLLLKNEGEYDIPPNKVIASISGIRAEDFNIPDLNKVLTVGIDGKTIRNNLEVPGSEEELTFEAVKYKHDLKADFATDVIVHACYSYVTHAVASVCLKKNLLERDVIDTCEVENSAVNYDTSSAPVQVSNVIQVPRGKNQVKLTFDVSNGGSGEVYLSNAFTNTCYGGENLRDQVKINVDSPAGKLAVKCKTLSDASEGSLKLIEGKRTVDCTIDTSSLQDVSFETPVLIDVSYFYRESVSKKLTVLAGE